MKVYQTNEIKNISILGSSGSGKTTLAEAMLYEGGVIKRRGSVENKNTVCDYFPVEKEYGYSVFSTGDYQPIPLHGAVPQTGHLRCEPTGSRKGRL